MPNSDYIKNYYKKIDNEEILNSTAVINAKAYPNKLDAAKNKIRQHYGLGNAAATELATKVLGSEKEQVELERKQHDKAATLLMAEARRFAEGNEKNYDDEIVIDEEQTDNEVIDADLEEWIEEQADYYNKNEDEEVIDEDEEVDDETEEFDPTYFSGNCDDYTDEQLDQIAAHWDDNVQ